MNKITKVLKTSQHIISETVANEYGIEKPKERSISPEKIEKIIDDLRLT